MAFHDGFLPGDGVLVTGARGLVGAAVVREILAGGGRTSRTRVYALSRTPGLLPFDLAGHPHLTPLQGDLRESGLGLGPDARRAPEGKVGLVIHAAADTRFSQTGEEAAASNLTGTANLLELVAAWDPAPRFCFVSTAFVAGRRTGRIPEDPGSAEAGWVNAYEWSKFEAEGLVRRSGLDHLICRSATIACDTPRGEITQLNALHRALRLCHRGLVPMLPGADDTPLDLVPCDYVARAIVDLSRSPDTGGSTYHLAAGEDAIPLGEMFDRSYAWWAGTDTRRSRAELRPLLTDLDTYRLFEATVLETASTELRRITRALSHFVPQLALPKTFETRLADDTLGYRPPPVRAWWSSFLLGLGGHLAPGNAGERERSVA